MGQPRMRTAVHHRHAALQYRFQVARFMAGAALSLHRQRQGALYLLPPPVPSDMCALHCCSQPIWSPHTHHPTTPPGDPPAPDTHISLQRRRRRKTLAAAAAMMTGTALMRSTTQGKTHRTERGWRGASHRGTPYACRAAHRQLQEGRLQGPGAAAWAAFVPACNCFCGGVGVAGVGAMNTGRHKGIWRATCAGCVYYEGAGCCSPHALTAMQPCSWTQPCLSASALAEARSVRHRRWGAVPDRPLTLDACCMPLAV